MGAGVQWLDKKLGNTAALHHSPGAERSVSKRLQRPLNITEFGGRKDMEDGSSSFSLSFVRSALTRQSWFTDKLYQFIH